MKFLAGPSSYKKGLLFGNREGFPGVASHVRRGVADVPPQSVRGGRGKFRPRMKGLRSLLHVAVLARVSLVVGGESGARWERDDDIVAG